jgi:hypothetical protein
VEITTELWREAYQDLMKISDSAMVWFCTDSYLWSFQCVAFSLPWPSSPWLGRFCPQPLPRPRITIVQTTMRMRGTIT